MSNDSLGYLPISADSHIAEPPHCWIDYIDPAFRDRAPGVRRLDSGMEAYVIDNHVMLSGVKRVTSAGWTLEQLRENAGTWADVNPGGYEPKARLVDQDRDGVAAELIYPSMGMVISGLPDLAYKNACFKAYNQWLELEFCSGAPDRLFGVGCTAAVSVEETVRDLEDFARAGFRGAMFAPSPGTEADFDDPSWDPVWRASVELGLPVSFHCLTSARDNEALAGRDIRGPKINGFQSIVRVCQDIIGMFVFGGVFDRVPELRLVSVEADAGWGPHWAYRADHAYNVHRSWLTCPELGRLPSEYFRENVYLTFQDDVVAFARPDAVNDERLLWANDYPHSDSTWPHSRAVIAEHTAAMDGAQRRRILRDNVVDLYRLEHLRLPQAA